jgi:hypothetical protein
LVAVYLFCDDLTVLNFKISKQGFVPAMGRTI